MNATDIIDTGRPLPRLASVRSIDGAHRLIRVAWAEGPRAGRTEPVDLSPLVDTHKFYAPLRGRSKLFDSVHLINAGNAIAWGDDDAIDMAASSIQRLAEETMTAADFRQFLARNRISQEAAAAYLGRSKRMLAYYLEQGVLPRLVTLACYGYEARYLSRRESYVSTMIATSKIEQLAFGNIWRVPIPSPPAIQAEKGKRARR
jgi:hypothetical protein